MQMCAGLAQLEQRTEVTAEDVSWVVQSGRYQLRPVQRADTVSRPGLVHGLAVCGNAQGALLDIEAAVTPGNGQVTVTGIVEEEELGQEGRRMKRKSTARGSAENVRTMLAWMGYELEQLNLHINFPGGVPVDGPSAGAAMAVAAVSAITGRCVEGCAAVTGEIGLLGRIRAVGGVPAKVEDARAAGLSAVYIPLENAGETLHVTGIEIRPVATLEELLQQMLGEAIPLQQLAEPPAMVGAALAAAARQA